jgi:CDGSH-type Zn-finger protein
MKDRPKIKVSENGPYIVTGKVPLYEYTIVYDKEGHSKDYKLTKTYEVGDSYALCRCGGSKNKPFCDGSHTTINFDGNETASRKSYIECAKNVEGPVLSLTDYTELCAYARFCDSNGSVWRLVDQTDNLKAKKDFIRQCQHCPSGRLVAWDNKTGKPIEEKYEPSIVLIQDPYLKCSGPIWVRGGIIIEAANGKEYEPRNRVTLCRCGKSHNKPFCNGIHASIKFSDKN